MTVSAHAVEHTLLLLSRHQLKLGAVVVLTALVGVVILWIVAKSLRRRPAEAAVEELPPFELPDASTPSSSARPIDPAVASILSKAASQPGDERTTADLVEGAIRIVTELGGVSLPALQRKLEIDFHTASELVYKLEEEGYVSEAGAGGKRKVLPAAYDYAERLATPPSES